MNIEQKNSKIYEDLLNISQKSLKEIQERAAAEDNATLKALLKLQASNRITDDNEAIKQLKLAKSHISTFARSTANQNNQLNYRKVLVGILSCLVCRLFGARRFKQASQFFKQLYQQINSMDLFRQSLHNILGLTSLVAIDNYNVQESSQFKYSAQVQLSFLYLVGKVKSISHKLQESKQAFQKILLLKNSINISQFLLIRIYSYLGQIDPLKHRSQSEKLKAFGSQKIAYTNQEKQCQKIIIKNLLQKQYELNRKVNTQNPKLARKRLEFQLKKTINQESKIDQKTRKYIQNLIEVLSKQNNQTVLKQILSNSDIAKQIFNKSNKILSKIQLITLNYCFKKIKANVPNFSVPKVEQKSNLKSGLKKPYNTAQSKRIPNDYNRANEILKKCQLGSNLTKINFGNTSIKARFVKINEKQLTWADNQAQIQYSTSKVKWKHVLGIVYGKVSENIKKQKFWHLAPWRCFSLITEDRSVDFYCEDQSIIFLWLQGISYKLQLFHKNVLNYPFYSKGRALWKMTLLKMGSKNKLNKKFSIVNAGSVIGFKSSLQSNAK